MIAIDGKHRPQRDGPCDAVLAEQSRPVARWLHCLRDTADPLVGIIPAVETNRAMLRGGTIARVAKPQRRRSPSESKSSRRAPTPRTLGCRRTQEPTHWSARRRLPPQSIRPADRGRLLHQRRSGGLVRRRQRGPTRLLSADPAVSRRRCLGEASSEHSSETRVQRRWDAGRRSFTVGASSHRVAGAISGGAASSRSDA